MGKNNNADGAESERIGYFAANFSEFIEDHKRLYMCLLMPVTFMGYGLFLLFPALAAFGLDQIYQAALVTLDSTQLAYGVVLFLGGIYSSVSLLRIKPSPPAGVQVTQEKMPELYALVEQLRLRLGARRLNRIIIDEQPRVALLDTPAWFLPLYFTRTLVIGLPLLQCLAPLHCKILLAQALVRPTRGIPVMAAWLSRRCDRWEYYGRLLDSSPGLLAKVLAPPMRWYAASCQYFAAYARRLAIQEADERSSGVFTLTDTAVALQSQYLLQRFLQDYYLPRVENLMREQLRRLPFAHAKLAYAYRYNLGKLQPARWLEQEMQRFLFGSRWRGGLVSRLVSLGISRYVHISLPEETAAQCYLGAYHSRVINTVDMLWFNKQAARWRVAAPVPPAQPLQPTTDVAETDAGAADQRRVANLL